MNFTKTTEQSSHYEHLEKMSVADLLANINKEDKTVPLAVKKALPQIEALVTKTVEKMKLGGRLFYIGAGTSGRLRHHFLRYFVLVNQSRLALYCLRHFRQHDESLCRHQL